MPPKPRTYDPVKVRKALVAQTEAVRAAVHRLDVPDSQLAAVLAWLPEHLDDEVPGGPVLSPTGWVAAWRPGAVGGEFDAAADALLGALDGLGPERVVVSRFGPMRAADFLLTLLVELVVHAEDLGAGGFPHERQALAAVSRLLADAFAEQVPGGAVELRVPPFAVVQAVPGPRHTRGTPPNVVETDPLTWIRLATGRLTWAEVVDAELSASGERSDLSAYLPVMGQADR